MQIGRMDAFIVLTGVFMVSLICHLWRKFKVSLCISLFLFQVGLFYFLMTLTILRHAYIHKLWFVHGHQKIVCGFVMFSVC